jgi:hypothetical protein
MAIAALGDRDASFLTHREIVEPLACTLYGEERTVVPVPGTRLAVLCGAAPFPGFHFCGYGLAAAAAERLEAAGLVEAASGAAASRPS